MGFMRVICSVSVEDWKIVPAKIWAPNSCGEQDKSHDLYNPEQWSFLLSVGKEEENKKNTFVLQKQLK